MVHDSRRGDKGRETAGGKPRAPAHPPPHTIPPHVLDYPHAVAPTQHTAQLQRTSGRSSPHVLLHPAQQLQFRAPLMDFIFSLRKLFWCGWVGGRGALEGGGGAQRRSQRQLDRRLEGVAKAVGGGYCRLQMPSSLALAFRGTLAGRRLGALEGRGEVPPPLPMHPWWGGHAEEPRLPAPGNGKPCTALDPTLCTLCSLLRALTQAYAPSNPRGFRELEPGCKLPGNLKPGNGWRREVVVLLWGGPACGLRAVFRAPVSFVRLCQTAIGWAVSRRRLAVE